MSEKQPRAQQFGGYLWVPGRCGGGHRRKQDPSVYLLRNTPGGRCPGEGRTSADGAGVPLARSAFTGALPRGLCSVSLQGLLPVLPIVLFKCISFQGGRGQGQGGRAEGAVPANPQDGPLGLGRRVWWRVGQQGAPLQRCTRLGHSAPAQTLCKRPLLCAE